MIRMNTTAFQNIKESLTIRILLVWSFVVVGRSTRALFSNQVGSFFIFAETHMSSRNPRCVFGKYIFIKKGVFF